MKKVSFLDVEDLVFHYRLFSASAPNFIPTPRFPALQYFDSVDKGGLAERAGLRPGDFILEVRLF